MTPHEKACLKIEAVMQWPIAAGFALSSHDACEVLREIHWIILSTKPQQVKHERLSDEAWEKEKGAPQPGGEKPVAQLAPYNF